MSSLGLCCATKDSSRAEAPHSQEYEHETEEQDAWVTLCGNGAALHWAAIFCFASGRAFVCELSAIADSGARFSANRSIVRQLEDVERFLREKDCARLEHGNIRIRTSPADLLQRCSTFPRNGERYDIFKSNCQHWLRTLLVDGYGSDENLLPERAGAALAWGLLFYASARLWAKCRFFTITAMVGPMLATVSGNVVLAVAPIVLLVSDDLVRLLGGFVTKTEELVHCIGTEWARGISKLSACLQEKTCGRFRDPHCAGCESNLYRAR